MRQNIFSVTQRASLRLAKEMKLINGEERNASEAATAITARLAEPMLDTDIDGLALITRVDRDALRRAAAQAGSSRAAATAH